MKTKIVTLIVHAEAKFFFEFLNEENKDDYLRVTNLNEIFA